jgi:hypothetical protein
MSATKESLTDLELELIERLFDSGLQADPMAECRRAIADAFVENEERLDVRHLWTRGDARYFRVNWWSTDSFGAGRIRRSAFVSVEATKSGLVVRDLTTRAAA